MTIDTETAKIMMRSAEQANAIAEEATRRVVHLMQEAIQDRERIAELESWVKDVMTAHGPGTLASNELFERGVSLNNKI